MSLSLFDIQFGLNIGPWENKDLVPCLTKLTGQGYNGVEVTFNTYRNYSDRITILKEIVDNVGIQIVSYVLKLDFRHLSKDSSILDQFQKVADFIQKMGGKYIIIEQGIQAGAEQEEDIDVLLQEFERAITDFSGICSDSGAELVYSPTPDSFIRSERVLEQVVELIYPLGVRMSMDVCDMMKMGFHPIEVLRKYLDAISIVHLSDMKILKGKKSHIINEPQSTILGQGKVDLKSVWHYLQANEYKGWIVARSAKETNMSEDINKTTQYLNKGLEVFLTNVL